MLAGGSEFATTPLAMGGFCSARAMTTRNDDPKGASRPYDIDRDGFVLSNGAGCVVLERAGTRESTWCPNLRRSHWLWNEWRCLSQHHPTSGRR